MHSKKKNIVLLGVSGVGKSTLGLELANQLGLGFSDTDHQIEQLCQKSVTEIIAEQGEQVFRDLESAQLSSMNNIENHVISLGAGATQNYWELPCLVERSTSIWLQAEVDKVVDRLLLYSNQIEKRPLLAKVVEDKDFALVKLKAYKHKFYEILSRQIDIRKCFYERADYIFELLDYSSDSNAKRLVSFVKGDFKSDG